MLFQSPSPYFCIKKAILTTIGNNILYFLVTTTSYFEHYIISAHGANTHFYLLHNSFKILNLLHREPKKHNNALMPPKLFLIYCTYLRLGDTSVALWLRYVYVVIEISRLIFFVSCECKIQIFLWDIGSEDVCNLKSLDKCRNF